MNIGLDLSSNTNTDLNLGLVSTYAAASLSGAVSDFAQVT